uniref:Putative secreted protein n=1 Tax=Ixodes ricinus TaxID=34613 RepID=A0A6B0UJG1_IXORI
MPHILSLLLLSFMHLPVCPTYAFAELIDMLDTTDIAKSTYCFACFFSSLSGLWNVLEECRKWPVSIWSADNCAVPQSVPLSAVAVITLLKVLLCKPWRPSARGILSFLHS